MNTTPSPLPNKPWNTSNITIRYIWLALLIAASIAYAEPEVRRAIPVEPETGKQGEQKAPATPTVLSEYSITIDNHFTVDVGADWERRRENGDSGGTLFRGSKAGVGIRITFLGEGFFPWQAYTDEVLQRITAASIADLGLEEMNANPNRYGNSTVVASSFKRTRVGGIDAVQIDIETKTVIGKGKPYERSTLRLFRHIMLNFEDGRSYVIMVLGDRADREADVASVINSILPVSAAAPAPQPTPLADSTPIHRPNERYESKEFNYTVDFPEGSRFGPRQMSILDGLVTGSMIGCRNDQAGHCVYILAWNYSPQIMAIFNKSYTANNILDVMLHIQLKSRDLGTAIENTVTKEQGTFKTYGECLSYTYTTVFPRGDRVSLSGKFFRVGDVIYEIIAGSDRGVEHSVQLLNRVAESFTILKQAKPAPPEIPVKKAPPPIKTA
jgi:hypothetical protein